MSRPEQFLPFFVAWNSRDLTEQLFVGWKRSTPSFLWKILAILAGISVVCMHIMSFPIQERPRGRCLPSLVWGDSYFFPLFCCYFGFQIVWIFLYQCPRTPVLLTLVREDLKPWKNHPDPSRRRCVMQRISLKKYANCTPLSAVPTPASNQKKTT